MDIRIMEIDDYTAIYDLWMSCKGMGLNDIDDSKKGVERFLNRNPDTCFVAVENNALIGVIMAGNDGRRGFIYHTAVLPSYRHQGIATQLVDTAMTALENIGITKVALVVFDRNENGNSFWEAQGFTSRTDLVYRNKSLVELKRFDT
ncbi:MULTISPECIES: GNAT family N-acetyltransferase [Hungatella]|uniref:GNAT family N-acetyltransferase n=1 Tax=Hungatella hathewayi TaxID=154046 RepID=A0AAW9WJD2_9FIRM|nr:MULTISPECIES: GNAT family N-acetyltransferase [Hungatella]MCQ4831807.1 GNAT family N-acetyltransferase [Hungatella sp. SL.1.14]MUB63467.1 GNAT family N-acetyltransferase [Hungatella hathewayi]CUQ60233.1 N-acetyltransferase GCN5 [Hungatella hathewayi]